jgi:tRNA threonylcarbamoyladenosine biosynthesis protein TsaE
MATFTSHSPEETLALGEAWGRAARRGDVFALSGDLGAGKTQLVKGIALGLGSAARVHSPTFTLLNQYDGGRLPLFHLDLYRLNSPQQVIGAGLEPYLADPDGVTVVEWAERWFGEPETRNPKPETTNVRWVKLEATGETERRINYDDPGA